MRTEGGEPAREAAAVGIGFFIGCTPLYGFHLVLVLLVGQLLRLNRLKMYIAANISNPFFAPLLILLQIQTGAWLQRGEVHPLTLDAVRATDPWTYGVDLLIGSLVVGVVGGIATAAATYATSRPRHAFEFFDTIAASAADRYLQGGIIAWEFARGKLRGDPIYREVITGGLLPSGGVLVDIGCGQGLMLAALAETRRRIQDGQWPATLASPPMFDSLFGIELRPRVAGLAARALDEDAAVLCADATAAEHPDASAVLLFDVLHLISGAAQQQLMRAVASRLGPDGVVLVREADANGGWAFRFVRFGNRLKALVTGNSRQRFTFRSGDEWRGFFDEAGFDSDVREMGSGTPFANVLFTLRLKR